MDAYKLAYMTANMNPRTIQSAAQKLRKDLKIHARLEEIAEQKDYHARLSEEFVIGELVQNHYRALDRGELGNSNRSLELLGRNLNLWKEQTRAPEQLQALFAWIADGKVDETAETADRKPVLALDSPDDEE